MNMTPGFKYSSDLPGGAYNYLFPEVLKILSTKRIKGKVLDIGCGNGSVARGLEKKGFDVWGCEWNLEGVEIANKVKPGRFIQWDLNNSAEKFPWEGFDAVISTEVIEHLFFPRNLFKLARRVLCPSGLIVITTPYHGYLKNNILAIAGKWDRHHDVHQDGGHIKFFSPRTLGKMMNEGGFSMLGWKGVGRMPFLWKSLVMWGQRTV